MEFVKKNIKWITIGACVLTIIGLFLPMVSMSLEFLGETSKTSIIYIEHDGAIVFAAMVIACVFILLNKEAIAVAPILAAAGLTIYESTKASTGFSSASNAYASYKIGFDIGFYIIIAGLIIATAAILYNLFGIKKMTFSEVVQSVTNAKNGKFNTNSQPQNQVVYAQYGNTNNTNYGFNSMTNNQGGYDSFNQQPVAQPNYNGGYQPPMQNGYNNDFNVNNNSVAPQGVMPTANVDTNIFNQQPVSQPNMPMENPQPVDIMQSNMMNQPVMNTVPQQAPVQDFSNPVSSVITCPQCRATLNSGMSFCNQCGSKIN